MIKEGIYTDLSSENYHNDKNSISRSALMDFDKSPYTYWAKHLNPHRPIDEPTRQMILGSAFHSLILEPHLFGNFYAVLPDKVYLKDVGREVYDTYKKNAEKMEMSGKIILTSEEMQTLRAMELKIVSNEKAMRLIRDSRIENSFFWTDPDSGLTVKARPDVLHDNMIVDLKSCANASPRAFQYAMVDGGYHLQGAIIREGVRILEGRTINNIINICVETKYPHNMAIYIIDEFAIETAHEKFKRLLLELKNATTLNEFQDFGIQTISLPRWATYE